MADAFARFAHAAAEVLGSAWAFLAACLSIVVWLVLGPVAHWSDTWQLWANTATTVVTFLMVFIIQNTQNRDARATALKLDALIAANEGVSNRLMALEHKTEDELRRVEQEERGLAESADA